LRELEHGRHERRRVAVYRPHLVTITIVPRSHDVLGIRFDTCVYELTGLPTAVYVETLTPEPFNPMACYAGSVYRCGGMRPA
jgi:hypothetical protein